MKTKRQLIKPGVLAAALAVLAGLAPCPLTQAQPVQNGAAAAPVKVEVRKVDDHYQLFVDHKPFYIKGAGLEFGNQEKLAEHGGNSFRTWRTDNGQKVLD